VGSDAERAAGDDIAPVTGTCARCGCALGYQASARDGAWYCCGACAGSGRCQCGCRDEWARPALVDALVPTRRMFASRPPDELRVPSDRPTLRDRARAFPFADRRRGR
jgi:hypothetical protein